MEILEPEPEPVVGTGDMWLQVLERLGPEDPLYPILAARRQQGIDRYKVPLQKGNGRNFRVDLLQEIIDSIAYAEHWLSEDPTEEEKHLLEKVQGEALQNLRALLRLSSPTKS